MKDPLLSRIQIQQLGMAATLAFNQQEKLDLIPCPPDLVGASKTARAEFWRHQQVAEVTRRVCSFKDCRNSEYLKLKQHFEALGGVRQSGRAAATTARLIGGAACHREPGCEWLRQIHDWMRRAGFTTGYMVAVMKGKFRGETQVENLTERQLKALHDTVINRCRAKLGLGETANRNRKQRRS